jgi:epoxyqueuosine reductase
MVTDPSRGRISNYAWGVDYHEVMAPRLEALANWLQLEAQSDTSWRAYVDTGAILERDHAESAGLGFTGKNTMLIGPRSGSWFFLGEVLTTAQLIPDEPAAAMPGCGTCHRCLDACPTDAFPQPYVLDARRCISYLTIELKSWISPDLRPLMGNWIFGCDICQVVCPFNRFAANTVEPAFRPVNWEIATPRLVDLLSLDDRGFRDRFGRSPISRIKRRGLLRNGAIAAGNWGSPVAVPPLSRLLSDFEPIIRGHAAWGLGRIGTQQANQALSKALETEGEIPVRQEIETALGL